MKDKYLDSLLGENEKILLEAHQHWLLLFEDVLPESMMALVILIVFTLIGNLWAGPVALLGLLLMAIPLAGLARDILDWRNRKFVVTNRRVIQLSGIINKNVIDSSLEKVNDVKMEQTVLGRICNYGDIEILTASELGVNLVRRIWKPVRYKTTMLNAKERLEKEHAGLGPARQETDIPALIAQLDNLRQQGVLSEEEFQAKKAELLAKL